MRIVLPTEKTVASRVSPKIFVLYSKPKVGKTKLLSELEGCCTLDTEDGTAYFDMLRITITNADQIDEVFDSIMEEGRKRAKEGKKGDDLFPYKYIAIDTADALEDMCEASATRKFKESIMGSTFKGKSIIELPKGGGYYYLRNELMEKIMLLSKVCKGLIVVAHLRDKTLMKEGTEVSMTELSFTGRISAMVCAKADAIGYLYRDKDDAQAMISFETLEESSIMGSRCPHLAGKTFPFSWDKIYID